MDIDSATYAVMTVRERAELLLDIGVVARPADLLDSELAEIGPLFWAYVDGFGQLPVPAYATERAAIAAGMDWLEWKAGVER